MNATKTVYSYVYPQTASVVDALWSEKPHWLYADAVSGWQDDFDKEFLSSWKEWASSVVSIPSDFSFQYVSSGSSEAIRCAISKIAVSGVRLHTFVGEYEGYKALASPLGVEVVEHERSNWQEIAFDEGDVFFLSQPSAIDGNVWEEYQKFLVKHSSLRVFLDVCYVGATVHNEYRIPVMSNVETVFFSLSKIFGVYYHRIGGCFSRKPIEGLFGNKWFKNMFAIELGKRLLDQFSIGELPATLTKRQKRLCEKLMIMPSDVVLLGHSSDSGEFSRGSGSRYCLTAMLEEESEKS